MARRRPLVLTFLCAVFAVFALVAPPQADAHDGEFPHAERVWGPNVGCLEFKNKGPVDSTWEIRSLISDDWAGLGVALKLDNACSGTHGDIFYRQVSNKPYCVAWDPNMDIGTADGAQEEVISLNENCGAHRAWACDGIGHSLGGHSYDHVREPATQNPGCLRNGLPQINHSSGIERSVVSGVLG